MTVATTNHLPGVMTLLESLRRHHPNVVLYTCLVEGGSKDRPPEDPLRENCFDASDCFSNTSEWSRFSFQYPAFPLSAALKPRALQRVLEMTGMEVVIYLDSDILITSPLDPLLESLQVGSIAITPHRINPGFGPKAVARMINSSVRGVYNSGILGIRSDLSGKRFLEWWTHVTRTESVNDFSRRVFVDQSWLEFVPTVFSGVVVCRHPGVNVAYWNLDERNVSRGSDGWLANGLPLSTFHFSGFDPYDPECLSRYVNRKLDDSVARRVIAPLSREYAESLMKNGYLKYQDCEYSFQKLNDGTKIQPEWRELIRLGLDGDDKIEDPFNSDRYVGSIKISKWYCRQASKVTTVTSQDCLRWKLSELCLQMGRWPVFSSIGKRLGKWRQFKTESQRWR